MTDSPPPRGPVVARDRAALDAALGPAARRVEDRFVPTMGALHDGHAALIRAAAADRGPGGRVVVSIFVNPTQFAPGEDFERYPRTFDADLAACRDAGADVVFAPAAGEMYPGGDPDVTVRVGGALAAVLEGEHRPGHFDGVATVVLKLLHLVRPAAAYFGEKDFQQLAVVRRAVADLNVPVEVVGVPTVRGADGLALSSRNRYLSPAERSAAVALPRGLAEARDALAAGADAGDAERRLAARLADAGFRVDYAAVRDAATLGPPAGGPLRVLAAATIGSTRLIDNVAVPRD